MIRTLSSLALVGIAAGAAIRYDAIPTWDQIRDVQNRFNFHSIQGPLPDCDLNKKTNVKIDGMTYVVSCTSAKAANDAADKKDAKKDKGTKKPEAAKKVSDTEVSPTKPSHIKPSPTTPKILKPKPV